MPSMLNSQKSPKNHHGTLRGKFMRGLIPITLGSLLILGAASAFITYQTKKQDVFEIAEQNVNYTSSNIERVVSRQVSNFWINVAVDSIDNIGTASINSILNRLLEEESNIVISASFMDLKGNTLAEKHSGQEELLTWETTEAFRVASLNKVYISPVWFVANKPYIRISSPVANKEGKVIGVLTGVLNFNDIQKIVKETKIGNSGFSILLDRESHIIASGSENYFVVDEVKNGALSSLPKNNNKNSKLIRDENGKYIVVTKQKLANPNWMIVSIWPAVDAFSVMFTVAWQIVIVFLLAGLFVYIFSWLIAARVVSPIEKLREAALLLGEGKFQNKIQFRTNDELDDLIEGFNSMSTELERLVSEIVQKQKTITKQKDEFVFIAAHELRAPVTAVRWVLDDVINNPKRRSWAETIEYLKKAFSANERLVQLISDLLEVARSDSNKMTLNIQPVDIKTVVETSITEMSSLAEKSQHQVTYLNQNAVSVLADQNKLDEVMNNLVSNAIKYMKPGGKIEIYHETKAGQLITSVKDDGFGMSAEAQKQLFTKFYRVESDETKDIQGTGLGLFITKQLVEKMGGRIWVESKPGLGSIFSFSLPIAN